MNLPGLSDLGCVPSLGVNGVLLSSENVRDRELLPGLVDVLERLLSASNSQNALLNSRG